MGNLVSSVVVPQMEHRTVTGSLVSNPISGPLSSWSRLVTLGGPRYEHWPWLSACVDSPCHCPQWCPAQILKFCTDQCRQHAACAGETQELGLSAHPAWETSPTHAAPWNPGSVRWELTSPKSFKYIHRYSYVSWNSVFLTFYSFNTHYFGFKVNRLSSCSGFCLKESHLLHETCLFISNINPQYLGLIIVFISSPFRNAEYNTFFSAFSV